MKMKMENDAAAFLRSYVTRRGRNVQLAESAVRESKSFSDDEALAQHLIDLIAPTKPSSSTTSTAAKSRASIRRSHHRNPSPAQRPHRHP
jgi:membrane-bound ClpP family serine protease